LFLLSYRQSFGGGDNPQATGAPQEIYLPPELAEHARSRDPRSRRTERVAACAGQGFGRIRSMGLLGSINNFWILSQLSSPSPVDPRGLAGARGWMQASGESLRVLLPSPKRLLKHP